MIKVLMLSPYPDQSGGVADYVAMLKANLPPDILVEGLFTGKRLLPFILRPFSPLLPVYDGIRLIVRLLTRRYDVVHLNPSFNSRALLRDSLFMLILRLFSASKVLVFIHGWNDVWANRILSGRLSRALFQLLWGGADRILLLASRFKQSLVEAGLNSLKIDVVTTMFDAGQFNGLRPAPEANSMQVLFLSRFVREKGIYELLEGFFRVSRAYPEAKLICAGDGPEAAGMRDWVEKHSLQDRVHFAGFVRGLAKAQLLTDSGIFAFPTYYGEGCPVSLLEAMAAGCAVITGDAGGIPDFFKDGVNGVLIRQPTADKVESALRRLLAAPLWCSQVGEHNRLEAGARYNARNVSSNIAAEYSTLARFVAK
jgi:glycosyltransferase involved in cell wall biosynthesis